MRRNNDVLNARGAPRPLIRSALLRPLSGVHSLWSINPGGNVCNCMSTIR